MLKAAQGPGPHLVEVRAEACYPFGIELIQAAGTILDIRHQARILQDFEVLRYGWTCNRQRAGEFIYSDWPSRELLKDRHPGGVAKSIESGP